MFRFKWFEHAVLPTLFLALTAFCYCGAAFTEPDKVPTDITQADEAYLVRVRRATCGRYDCKNGGQCITSPAVLCLCPEPYFSFDCSVVANYCQIIQEDKGISVPVCLNGGNCTANNMTPPYFTCTCAAGYTGIKCETHLDDDCASKPCVNGQCTDLVRDYNCSCYAGWEGKNCSVDTDYCKPMPCMNGGKCSDGNSTFTCDCSTIDYRGDTCSSKIDDCQPNPCLNGGICTDGLRSYKCNCAGTGFSGSDCSVDFPDCSPNPCEPNGVCFEKSKVVHYNLATMPSPFNGPFNVSQAVGFMCLYPASSGTPAPNQLNPANVATVAGITAAVLVLLSVSIFLIVLSQIGKGIISLGVFEKRQTAEQQRMSVGENFPLPSVPTEGFPYLVSDHNVDPAGNERMSTNEIPVKIPIQKKRHQNKYETGTAATHMDGQHTTPDAVVTEENRLSLPISGTTKPHSGQPSANAHAQSDNFVDDVYAEAGLHAA